MMNKSTINGGGTPRIVAPDFDAIEAVALHLMGNHWCAWKLEPRPGAKPGDKPAKVPYRSTKGRLSSQEPDKWLPYEEAKLLHAGGGFHGVGYLPMPEDGVVGLDADKVLGTDGEAVESAREIVAELLDIGSYVELSPSGTGLRAFVRGVKEGRAQVTFRGHSCEAYQPAKGWEAGDGEKPHYLTVTGRPWGEPRPVEAGAETQTRLEDYLLFVGLMEDSTGGSAATEMPDGFAEWKRRTDDEVETLLLSSLNLQGKINKAWAGDSTVAGGVSEARYSVIKQLWYITRDPAQIRRLVCRSKLDSSKFEERRNSGDFLDYEIQRAGKRQLRNYDHDRAAKKAQGDRQRASASALKAKAQEVTGLRGIEDLKTSKGALGHDLHTATELLIRDCRLAGVVFYDEFAGMVRKTIPLSQSFGDQCASKAAGPWLDDDDLAMQAWLRREWGVDVLAATAKGAARRWAMATSMNPVRDRLQELADSWDEVRRLDDWLVTYMGAEATTEDARLYLAEVGKRFLIGVVARAFKPGAQQHQMIVLEGPQGAGKSAAVRALALAVASDAYLEGFTLTDNKDCLLQLRGKLIGEWGELAGFGKRESESVKAFLTRGEDEYRDPYGSRVQKWPRTASFIASTNEGEYLRDASGNRRYWPVRVGRVEIVGFRQTRRSYLGRLSGATRPASDGGLIRPRRPMRDSGRYANGNSGAGWLALC